MEEIRKDVVGYEGKYMISNQGNIMGNWHGEWNLLSISYNNKGYCKIQLRKDGKQKEHSIHRLVATMFLGVGNDGDVVNHKDGIRDNNNANNLERCTQSENCIHAYRVLGRKPMAYRTGKKGCTHPTSKKVIQMDRAGNYLNKFDSLTQGGSATNTSPFNISSCCKGKLQTAGGYKRKYI